MDYKFELKDMLGIGVTLVVVALVLAFGLQILGDVRDDMTVDSSEYNATVNGITGVGKLPDKLPIIGTVLVAVVIIGILLKFFRPGT